MSCRTSIRCCCKLWSPRESHSISKAEKGIHYKRADLNFFFPPRPTVARTFYLEVVKDSFFPPQPVNFPLSCVFLWKYWESVDFNNTEHRYALTNFFIRLNGNYDSVCCQTSKKFFSRLHLLEMLVGQTYLEFGFSRCLISVNIMHYMLLSKILII